MGQLLKLWNGLTIRQRASIGAVAILLFGGIYAFTVWHRERDFQPLFDNLSPDEAGQIVSRLKESGVEVRLNDSGTRILVPSALVAEQRLQLAAQGLPQTGRIGFEIFDQTNFGATDFTEHVNYQRAIEGELERSLMTIQEIERARVHITFAKNSVFLENQQPAKGSVMVKLRTGASIDRRHCAAIAHLVASAVEGLRPEQVSIIDMRGNLLSQPQRPEGSGGVESPEGVLQYQKRLEDELQRKLVATLDPLLGSGRYRSSVAVDLDMTSGSESSEIFDPDKSVMTSTQKQEDVTGSVRAGGIPGTASNGPRSASGARTQAGGAAGGLVRRSETMAFQTSRTVRNMVVPQGVLKRVSVSVLLDQKLRWEGSGPEAKRVLEAPDAETLDKIRELVTGAIGLLDERGDQLVVESLPFESTITEPPPEPPASKPSANPEPTVRLPEWLQWLPGDVPLWIWGSGGGALLVLLVGGAIWMLRKRRKRRVQMLPQSQALRDADRTPLTENQRRELTAEARAEGDDLESFIHKQKEMLKEKESATLASLKGAKVPRSQVEVLTGHLVETVAQDPSAAAQILRSWLTEDRR